MILEDLDVLDIIYLLTTEQISPEECADFTDDMMLDLELEFMDLTAIKHAGGVHMVHWDKALSMQ